MEIKLRDVPDVWLQHWIDILVKNKRNRFRENVLWSFLDEKLTRAEKEIYVSAQLSLWKTE